VGIQAAPQDLGTILFSDGFSDHVLLDSGDGRKLERYGRIVVDRPEPQAMWTRRLPPEVWNRADAVFEPSAGDGEGGKWTLRGKVPEKWPMAHEGLRFFGRLTPFRHLGVFPDQKPHWDFLSAALARCRTADGGPPQVLNLFAYTGVASLVAAKAGARVTHVDASKKALEWAKENQAESGLPPDGIRWILDDATKFVAREARRGRKYHGILLDPPKYGRGPKGEIWDLFESLPGMVHQCAEILADDASFMILTAYAVRASYLSLDQLMREALAGRGGRLVSGELAIRAPDSGLAVPTSLYSRWSADATA